MKIHEYQAKQLLKKFKVPILDGQIASTPQEAADAARQLGGSVWAVKAQIHAGGRGKGGGVKIAKSIQEVQDFADSMIGHPLVTPQTSPEGSLVRSVYVEKGCTIAQEVYVSVLIDRSVNRIIYMASASGGVDIEELAVHHPEKIQKLAVDPAEGFQPYHGRLLAYGLGFEGKTASKTAALLQGLYNAFNAYDASLIEINPLVITDEEEPLALDAKMTFDDNALYRHPDIEALRDIAEEDPAEYEATQHSLSYVKLDGNIGCMVNGAGLAMATMDVIKLYGGEPANFLDVGGGAPKERVTEAFKIILADQNVRGILVNIFGGIMRCDTIAEGIIAAAKEVHLRVPLVVRLEGTNVDLGKKILSESGLAIIPADDLADAAERVVQSVQKGSA
jgi:succinyl-CoA synthetase beta subunit